MAQEDQAYVSGDSLYILLKKRNKSGKSLITLPWKFTWSRDIFHLNLAGRAKYHHVDKRQFNTLRDLADEGVEMARAELSRAGPVG
eukprot:166414-Prorocentrum_minimum.AAC.4